MIPLSRIRRREVNWTALPADGLAAGGPAGAAEAAADALAVAVVDAVADGGASAGPGAVAGAGAGAAGAAAAAGAGAAVSGGSGAAAGGVCARAMPEVRAPKPTAEKTTSDNPPFRITYPFLPSSDGSVGRPRRASNTEWVTER
jgi:hypothetical protein